MTELASHLSNASVFVMTSNEEVNLRRCLDSVSWSDDVVILDSYSRDQTVAIARSYPNTRVFYRQFDDYSSQRNFGLRNIAYVNPWLLVLDADEAVEPKLRVEILGIVAKHIGVDVFLVRRKVVLNGKSTIRNSTYDFWIERLVRPQTVHYEGEVHEKLVFEGGYLKMEAAIEHHQFSKGIPHWFERRRKYAALEANRFPSDLGTASIISDLFSRNELTHRLALKTLFYKLPYRWLIYLLYNLIVKLSFLDGLVGLRYVLLEARSQYVGSGTRRSAPYAEPCQAHPTSGLRAPSDGADLLHDR